MARIAPSRRIPPHQLNALEARMQAYYAAVPDYPAFHAASEHPLEWGQVLAELRKRRANASPLAILEFGAGRSGFPTWLRQQLESAAAGPTVTITCQDVTATNRTHLQQVADAVVISPLQEGVLPQFSFDIVFSTHCFEHVARPEQLLHTLTGLLKPGGSLLLFAPRYDLPLYLSPSAGDLCFPQRLLLSLRLLAIRLFSRLRSTPAFVLDTKPACLDRPYRRDADAIHWVSSHDLHLFARRHGLAITELNVSRHASPLSKQWLIDQFGKLAIRLHKPESPRT
jgi:SAM-dependent methyltransferase